MRHHRHVHTGGTRLTHPLSRCGLLTTAIDTPSAPLTNDDQLNGQLLVTRAGRLSGDPPDDAQLRGTDFRLLARRRSLPA